MSKSHQTWPEEKCLADDVFKETIAALDRFNKRMLEAGYKVNKGAAAEVGQAGSKQAKASQRLKKAA